MSPTSLNMAKKKTAAAKAIPAEPVPRPKGRPKAGGRIATRFSMVASPAYLEFLVRLAAQMGKRETADAVRELIREGAEKRGEKPPLI